MEDQKLMLRKQNGKTTFIFKTKIKKYNKLKTKLLLMYKMEQLDIVKLIEENPITKLSNDYNIKLLNKN